MLKVFCSKIGRSENFQVKFNYDVELIDNIKKINSEYREYNKNDKSWSIRAIELYMLIKSYKGSSDIFFVFDDIDKVKFTKIVKNKLEKEKQKIEDFRILEEKKVKWLNYKKQLEETYQVHEDKIHQNLKEGVKLMPFQSQAVLFADAVRNVLMALEMGCGKTLISIAYVEYNNFNKVVVLTPNSLKFNYYSEVEKFTNSKSHVINWNKNKYTIEESKYIIINYDFFRSSNSINKFNKLNIKNIDCLIADECHRLKNMGSSTYKNFSKVFNKNIYKNGVESKVFMSGTPMNNRGYELFSVMNLISPLEFPRKDDFYEKYCGLTYDATTYGGWIFNSDSTNFELLYQNISAYVFRKRKDEVLKDLPAKRYERLLFDMRKNERDEYENILNRDFDENNNKINHLAKLTKARQYLSNIKVLNNDLIEFIEMILNNGEKIVIMDYYTESLVYLHDKYKDISVLHYGAITDMEVRRKMVDDFQNPNSNVKIFLSSIQTGKEGLTLTASSKIIVLTQPYTVSENEQVVDRVHRISQNKNVNVYYPHYYDTIDYKVFSMVENKKNEIKIILDNEEYKTSIDAINIEDLLNNLN